MSQIYQDNILYLFGSQLSPTQTTEEFSSSFLYSIDILQTPLKMIIEVNSRYSHYYPTLALLRNEFLIAIGGYATKHCESYSISNKKWKELPDLIEERYGASALCDNKYNFIYVFGGLNNETGKCGLTVFKLNMNVGIKWDTLVVMSNAECLAKMNSVIIKTDDRQVYILGGANCEGEQSNEIVCIDFKNKVITPQVDKDKQLYQKGLFISLRHGSANNNGNIYAMDDSEEMENVIHKIDKHKSSFVLLNEALHQYKKNINNNYIIHSIYK